MANELSNGVLDQIAAAANEAKTRPSPMMRLLAGFNMAALVAQYMALVGNGK